MATRDGARWLPEQLASIAAQTRPPDQLIASDDGSGDGTVAQLERFAEEARFPVQILRGPRTGVGDNFWQAAAAADCELVAWSDQDDVWHPAKLERCARAVEDAGCDLVSHSALVVDQALRPLGGRCPDYNRDAVLGALEGDPWHVPSGFATVFRRRLLDGLAWEARPRSHQTGRPINHDHAVALRAFASGRSGRLGDPLARYRQHDANVAGDPTTHGLASLRVAMGVGAAQFLQLAERARGYGEYVAGMPGAHPGAAAYFDALARRCERRAAVYQARGVAALAGSLAGSLRRRVYAPRREGGFGPLALAKDAVAIAVRAGR
jgi:hypothetical protein